ncbi:MAG: hypothetical protein WB608_07300 [Terracidiphilus sp.]
MGRPVENVLYCNVPHVPATSSHLCFGTRRGRIANLLFLMVVFVSFFIVEQTARSSPSNMVSDPPDPAMEQLPALAAPLAMNLSLGDNSVIGGVSKARRVIVIGFVGGFVRPNDQGHPEVQFAQYLRDHYHSEIYAEVFGNHHGRSALHQILRLLDSDGSSTRSPIKGEQPRIVIYGHSWGATETVVLARELRKRGIPVFLTIQVDSIGKFGRNDSLIPSNVANAINLYQSRGPLHGQVEIFAADPARTRIIGNLHMTYKGVSINCDNYPWYARTFNKPHHEIENDPRVWDLAASLIDSAVAGTALTTHGPGKPGVAIVNSALR